MTEEEIVKTKKCTYKITSEGKMKIECGKVSDELSDTEIKMLHGVVEIAEGINAKRTNIERTNGESKTETSTPEKQTEKGETKKTETGTETTD